jgi:pimeloyl-ACP methyl ester carboxylesterase
VHYLGFDEPRLMRFARQLARDGFLVATPDLADLKNYDLAPSAVDDIEASALHLLDAPDLGVSALPQRPTVMGISFSGGLGICAAGRPQLRNRLGGVFAFGGYGDLGRVLTFLASGTLPEGGKLMPHLYGQAVVARRLADHLVPQEEVPALREALRHFLQEDPKAFAAAVERLPPQSKRVATPCLNWDSVAMSKLLAPLAAQVEVDPRLSPERNTRPGCPLFFLHGAEDNVIPPSESVSLGRWAEPGGPTWTVVTGLIRHVELENKGSQHVSLGESWRLARLLTAFLRA